MGSINLMARGHRPGMSAERLLAEVGALTMVLAAAGAQAEEAAPSVPGDIIVTARYRPERLQEVPIAVTQIGREALDADPGATNVLQISQKVPALQIQSYSAKNTTITIRGLGNNSGTSNEGLEQGVGIYIDGVFHAKPAVALSELIGIESVSVLRGPQGTLFGKNTVAGAIDIKTIKPSFSFGAQGAVSLGDYDYQRLEASVTGPLTDTLAARLTVGARHRGGIVRNVLRGQDWDNRNGRSARLDLLFRPTDTFDVRLIGDYTRERGDMGVLVVKNALPAVLANGSRVRDFYQRAADIGYAPLPVDPFARRIDVNEAQDVRVKTGGLSAEINWRIGDHTLTSVTAWRRFRYLPGFDGDGTGATVQHRNIVQIRNDQYSEELRLASPSGPVEYVLGAFWYRHDAQDDHLVDYGKDAAKWYYGPTADLRILDGVRHREFYDPDTRSLSGFGQLTWHPTPAIDLTAGLRYTHETRHGHYIATTEGNAVAIDDLPVALRATATAARLNYATPGAYQVSAESNRLSGTVNLGYHPSETVFAYASYSWGFKSAGLNLVKAQPGIDPVVRPERVTSYELGLKSQFLDRSVTANLALFWTDDRDFQATILDRTPDGRSVSYISNVDKVRVRGVELEVQTQPVQGLSLGISGAFNDAEYVSYPNAPCPYLTSYQTICSLTERPLSGVSRWSGYAAADYAWPITQRLTGFVGGDYSYRSGFYSAPNLDPFTRIPAYGVANVHLGVRAPDKRWELSIWSRNLLGKDYYNTIAVNSPFGIVQAVPGDPRTVGATLRWNL